MAALRRFYEDEGFFDARVGRKLVWSPDLRSCRSISDRRGAAVRRRPRQVRGQPALSDAQLRAVLKLTEGQHLSTTRCSSATCREIVRAYGAASGCIYQPQTRPTRITCGSTPSPSSSTEPGHIELVYTIREGKEFRSATSSSRATAGRQDKLVLREFRDFVPGRRFNSGELQDAEQRLRHLPYFSAVTITPIGEEEGRATCWWRCRSSGRRRSTSGRASNSNGGIGGNITFEERNFDIANLPAGPGGHPAVLRPRVQGRRAGLPRQLRARHPRDQRHAADSPSRTSSTSPTRSATNSTSGPASASTTTTAGSATRSPWGTASITSGARAAQPPGRAGEDQQHRRPAVPRPGDTSTQEGKHPLTSIALTIVRDTTNPGPVRGPRQPHDRRGGSPTGRSAANTTFQKFTLSLRGLPDRSREDLLDRKTILGLRGRPGSSRSATRSSSSGSTAAGSGASAGSASAASAPAAGGPRTRSAATSRSPARPR